MTNLMTAKEVLRLQLGSLELIADSYHMELHRPTQQQTLVDGSFAETVLDVKPCILKVECRAIAADASVMKAALRTAMYANTAFDFAFDEMQFEGMTLRDILIRREENRQHLNLTLTLGGRLSGEEADS